MYRCISAVLLAGLLIASSKLAAASIGSVSDNKGSDCSIERGKEKLAGAKGAEIESNDAYVTANCASSITFKDDTKVNITENSRLVIDDFVYDPRSSGSGKLGMKVSMGTVRYASGQIAKSNPQQVAINTPTATVAVRGTDFTMTVDEAGQSMIVLLPSCKDPRDVKTYELEENRCKVGSIVVSNAAGTVTLDQAFHGTYVNSANATPTPPVILNTIESKLNNTLIIVKPMEIQRAIKEALRTKKDKEQEELDNDAQSIERRAKKAAEAAEAARILALKVYTPPPCDAAATICVRWDNPENQEVSLRGRGVAYRETSVDHYSEVKTQGYISNTMITITQNDSVASYLIGDGVPGGNVVTIKQNTGVLRR